MGYHTDFSGEFSLNTPLTPEHKAYLEAFNRSRRMVRDPNQTAELQDPVRKAAGLPLGPESAYFVGTADANFGQDRTLDILDYNRPPKGQPWLWCQWVPNDLGDTIEWDGGEKFYSYVDWIRYLLENFLKPWGYVLNGEVEWFGEESDDRGKIVITDNQVKIHEAVISWREVD